MTKSKQSKGPLPPQISKKPPKKREPFNVVLPDDVVAGQKSTRPIQPRPLKYAPKVDTRKNRQRVPQSRDDPEGENSACDFFFEGGGARVSRPVFRERTQDELWEEARPKIIEQYLQHAPACEARTINRLRQWNAHAGGVQSTCDECVPGSQRIKVICIEATLCVSVPYVTCRCVVQPFTRLSSCCVHLTCCSGPVSASDACDDVQDVWRPTCSAARI